MADLISLSEARSRVRAAADTLVDLESVPLAESRGCRLGRDFDAEEPWPSTDRSAMDGYGVRAGGPGLAAGTELRVVGVCNAGHPFDGEVGDGEAIRIMTGAVVPDCIDAVVPVENTGGYVDVGAPVTVNAAVAAGANIRRKGSEVAVGDRLLHAGQRIRTPDVGALAVLGVDPVPVFRRPVVAILATGDEVVPVDQQPAPHQVRNSNAPALAAQVAAVGGRPRLMGIAGDDPDSLRRLLREALDEGDVVLTIGGVSKGTHDLVHGILAESGVEEVFHGVKLKPGKPVFFGHRFDGSGGGVTQLKKKTFVFGLPGNPASTFSVFDLLVRPLLGWLAGGRETGEPILHARVAGQPFRRNWREQAVPTKLRTDAAGTLIAELQSSKPSGDPFGMTEAQGYALIPPDTDPHPELIVPVLLFSDRA